MERRSLKLLKDKGYKIVYSHIDRRRPCGCNMTMEETAKSGLEEAKKALQFLMLNTICWEVTTVFCLTQGVRLKAISLMRKVRQG